LNGKVPTRPFAIEMLTYLSNKYPLVICTAGEKEEVYAKLRNNNLEKFFKEIVTASDVTHSKPHPETYIKGAQKISLSPEDCLALEDTYAGALSAKNAGTTCFVVPNRYEKDKRDFSFTDKILESLRDVIDIFEHVD